MEFFATAQTPVRVEELQRHVRIDTLPQLCAAIDKVLAHAGERGAIYCLWGEFGVHREVIANGVRFTLPACPNALQWTLTVDQPGQGVAIHCTINRREHDADFIASLEEFVAAWKTGLEGRLRPLASAGRKPVGECGMWMA